MHFPTKKNEIWSRLQLINAEDYAFNRNYLDGNVSYLSPYISRGVISTRMVFEHLKKTSFTWEQSEKFIQELVWRDFFQQVWQHMGEAIHAEIKNEQTQVRSHDMPQGILNSSTGISAIDSGIQGFYKTGYLHNHLRMYIASLTCNLSRCHWKTPAKWMYYHLLDADWGSNACSWQWVAGTFSIKKYWANQENINKFCYTSDINTYLDVSYEDLPQLPIPDELLKTQELHLDVALPEQSSALHIDSNLKSLIYNWYNLDFNWYNEEKCNRILLLEPSVFEKLPISRQSIDFMINLSQNIKDIQIYVGEFKDLKAMLENSIIVYKEHPLNNYDGFEQPRDWLCAIQEKKYNGFFGFWKAHENILKAEFEN